MMVSGRAGRTIRPSLKSFWSEWALVLVGLIVTTQSGVVRRWVEGAGGTSEIFGFPVVGVVSVAGTLIAGYAIVSIGYKLLANRYTLTEDEVTETYGIIQRNRKVTRLEHIRRVTVEIGVMGRILGYGDVLYFTAGSDGVDVRLKAIADPEALAEEADALARKKTDGSGKQARERAQADGKGAERLLDAVVGVMTQGLELQKATLAELKAIRAALSSGERSARRPARKAAPLVSAPNAVAEAAGGRHEHERLGELAEDVVDPVPASLRPDDNEATEYDDVALEGSAGEVATPKMFNGWEDIMAPGAGEPLQGSGDLAPVQRAIPGPDTGEPRSAPAPESAPVFQEPVTETDHFDPDDTGRSESTFDPQDNVGLLAPTRGK